MFPRKRQLTTAQIANCLRMLQIHDIKYVARQFGVCERTIRNHQYRLDHENRIGRKKSTRKTKLTDDELDELKLYVQQNPFVNIDKIKNDLNISVCNGTISNYCKKILKLPTRRSSNKFQVPDEHRDIRVTYACMRQLWTVESWKTIVFRDESGLDNSGAQNMLVRRPLGERNNQRYIYRHVNKSLRVNYFSYISKFGVGKMMFYTTMDSDVYCQCVSIMIEDLKNKFQGQRFYVIHDNARFSQSKDTNAFLAREGFAQYFLDQPKYSPDMNIIENCWAILKRKVRKHTIKHGQLRQRDSFISLIEAKWNKIDIDICNNLYDSLPSRMQKVIDSEGHLIDN